MAQLGARLNGIQKVRGSNPLRSTKEIRNRKSKIRKANPRYLPDFGFLIFPVRGSNSVGRVSRCQRECRGFEPRLPLELQPTPGGCWLVTRRGAVAKWLRRRSAKPLFSGSIPLGASTKAVPAYAGIAGVVEW